MQTQPQIPQLSSVSDLQPESKIAEGPSALEDILFCPCPLKTHPATSSDYVPVALTSHVMMTLERLILNYLNLLVETW